MSKYSEMLERKIIRTRDAAEIMRGVDKLLMTVKHNMLVDRYNQINRFRFVRLEYMDCYL